MEPRETTISSLKGKTMYNVGFGSCSLLLHIIAKHPIGALAVGVLTLSMYLTSPLGPSVPLGADGILEQKEAAMLSAHPELKQQTELAQQAFSEVEDVALTDDAITYVLEHVCQCRGVAIEDIRSDKSLTRKIGMLYFLELTRTHGIAKAKMLYRNQ